MHLQHLLSFLFVVFGHRVCAYEHANVNVSRPQSNSPLNKKLAFYKLKGFNGDDPDLTHSFVKTSCGANISVHHTDPAVWGSMTGSAKHPVLILTHGYPESSYIWRHVTSTLSARVPVFVPDQPGYGLSTSCCNGTSCIYDKRTHAKALMEAVTKIYGKDVTVIYAGHDRGARTMHRAAVDNNYPGIKALGFFAADIVPFVAEWSSFENPFWAQNYFHWSFLPRGEFALDVIMAYGGGNWVHKILGFGSGDNEQAIELFKAGNAWEIYENFFDQLSVTNASIYDYQAGAFIDYQMQLDDQAAGIKVKIPTHIMYSIYNLGAAFDVPAVWANYTEPSAKLTTKGVGDGIGHFIIEEAPGDVIEQLNDFMDTLGVAAVGYMQDPGAAWLG